MSEIVREVYQLKLVLKLLYELILDRSLVFWVWMPALGKPSCQLVSIVRHMVVVDRMVLREYAAKKFNVISLQSIFLQDTLYFFSEEFDDLLLDLGLFLFVNAIEEKSEDDAQLGQSHRWPLGAKLTQNDAHFSS